jgi:hypothetical protein
MPMKNVLEDFDKKLFNTAVDIGHRMIDRGYVQAWFSWIEWIGLTALILVAAKRTSSGFLYFVAAISAFILFFVGLAGVEKLRDELLPSIKGSKIVVLIAAILISVFGMWVVMNVLFELLPASAAKHL